MTHRDILNEEYTRSENLNNIIGFQPLFQFDGAWRPIVVLVAMWPGYCNTHTHNPKQAMAITSLSFTNIATGVVAEPLHLLVLTPIGQSLPNRWTVEYRL